MGGMVNNPPRPKHDAFVFGHHVAAFRGLLAPAASVLVWDGGAWQYEGIVLEHVERGTLSIAHIAHAHAAPNAELWRVWIPGDEVPEVYATIEQSGEKTWPALALDLTTDAGYACGVRYLQKVTHDRLSVVLASIEAELDAGPKNSAQILHDRILAAKAWEGIR